jgi:hypothetical protein
LLAELLAIEVEQAMPVPVLTLTGAFAAYSPAWSPHFRGSGR